jgi:PleD family two-component response regulator
VSPTRPHKPNISQTFYEKDHAFRDAWSFSRLKGYVVDEDEDEDVIQLVRPIRVLILDDTRSARLLIRTLLVRTTRVEVAGEANDRREARDLIKQI